MQSWSTRHLFVGWYMDVVKGALVFCALFVHATILVPQSFVLPPMTRCSPAKV